ncbi:iron-containing alcohol dehydrogenase [Paenibacillus piri]|uniref:Iron-containing alcohol dehydrogenase n=1 Tax=Paenibacillus piri TaxID=2547395 RepID=A0A4R5K8G0_9BACL|nr:iron-containing alcohol dehydrogenase [Paenibacillus piri]TDF89742.1 iron-containing alcohol dehydrogenase [Paenibacillus piri]
MDYKYFMPTQVECGIGTSTRTGEYLAASRVRKVLLVTDAGIIKANMLENMIESLEAQGITPDIYDKVEPNPSAESIMNGLSFLNEAGADSVVAVGGGSSIDTAKGIAIMARNTGNILDYEGVGKIPNPGLPLIAIPTTAGTGSEVTPSTIVTNRATSFKAAVISPYLYPKLAILDPSLTLKLPQPITAATGMDALTHAIESYTSKGASPLSQAFALSAIKMIAHNIEKAYFSGTDLHSREQMLVASMMAGAAFAQSRLGNVHAISHTMGGIFNIAHGIANASLLPYVMKFNSPACLERMADIAEALGCDTAGGSVQEAAEMAIEKVIRLNQRLQIPSNIKDLGVELDQLEKMVEDSMRSGNVLINPRLTIARDIRHIIECAYSGSFDL